MTTKTMILQYKGAFETLGVQFLRIQFVFSRQLRDLIETVSVLVSFVFFKQEVVVGILLHVQFPYLII